MPTGGRGHSSIDARTHGDDGGGARGILFRGSVSPGGRVVTFPSSTTPAVVHGRAPALALLLFMAFVLRLAFAGAPSMIEWDGAYWASLARALARGDVATGLSTAWPPLFPASIALVARALIAGGASASPALFEWAARLVSVGAGTLLLLPLWFLGRRVIGASGAWITVLLAAVHPNLLEYSGAALSEMIFTLPLVAGTAGVLLRDSSGTADQGPGSRVPVVLLDAVAGACFGLAFLARPEGLPLGLGLWVFAVGTGTGPARSRLRPAFLVGLFLVASPYLLFLHDRLGSWSLGEKGPYNFWRTFAEPYARHFPPPLNLAARVNESPAVSAALAPEGVRVVSFILREPGAFLGATLARLGTLVVSTLPVTLLHPLDALAVVGAVSLRRTRPAQLLLLLLALACALYAPFTVDRRFLVPCIPFGLIFCAAGMAAIARRWPIIRPAWLVPVTCAALLLYAGSRADRRSGAPEARAAGEWLRSSAPAALARGRAAGASPRVMAREPWVAYYAEGLMVELPGGPLDSILARARARQAAGLVVGERTAQSHVGNILGKLGFSSRAQIAAWAVHRGLVD